MYHENYPWKVRDGSHDSRANCLQGGVAMSAGRTQDTLGPVAERSPSPVDPAQLLTLAELAERLKVSERWVYEKSRRRCLTPLPCIRIGRYLRFDWTSVSAWLRQRERGV
jgi:predicted DNA-binding transcriptional regulator AlpA